MSAEDGVSQFLKNAGWNDASLAPLKADFSTRRFGRLERAENSPRHAVLMQAAPDQKTPQFVAIAALLRRCGLSAPEIYAAGTESGLVLMEDFGDTTFGRLLDAGHEPLPLYRRAADVLAHLHKTFDPAWAAGLDLPSFNAAMFTAQTELFLDFYFPLVNKRAANGEERETFRKAWLAVLAPLDALPRSLMLRDFMPDNLMDLPEREGWRSVGLLDFQDGGIGPIAYDLASLCEGVRRDVPLALLDDVVAYYHAQNPVIALADLRRACRVLSAQRHTRVLGIVVRLAETQGCKDMRVHIPRIWNYLTELLLDDALWQIKVWFERNLARHEYA